MDNKDPNTEKKDCCGSSGGCGCGAHRCCGGKAALVLVLLLIGGLIGYAVGHCHSRMACNYAMSMPVAPSK
jgi:hypothetical protein